MILNGVEIENTYCEGFGGFFTRILVTAKNEKWVKIAAQEVTGYGTSGIGCDAEAAIDVFVPAEKTPDKRPGVILMFFMTKKDKVSDIMLHRIGQCILTCPTTACFDALSGSLDPVKEFAIKTGFFLKFFGDKYEEKVEGVYPFPAWKIPIMGGEFIVQSTFKVGKGIAGGNFLIIGKDQDSTLEAAEKAIEAIKDLENLITPFPGGIVPSGSKVGTRYENIPGLFATTNHKYCPTLRENIEDSELREGDGCVFEIVLDGATEDIIKKGMKIGIEAAVKVPGINRISAGNYGGKLGKFLFKLHELGLE
ncbi:MAG: formylmethanofuran--tetrahydromethanopterin N-formyltransferase [Promethearchaeota archaeon]|nr:MAG: formylmethanofuran--tetrahydromethanopterin N-formyltransferase [Candidatus Lokiarchaeota archaeon]